MTADSYDNPRRVNDTHDNVHVLDKYLAVRKIHHVSRVNSGMRLYQEYQPLHLGVLVDVDELVLVNSHA
jgi:hypothetical protein